MTHPSVHVQIAPTSVPSTPSWLGEVAVVAHVFSQLGLQKAIEERVRFVRARMGDYEVIDFVVMLIGYAVSGERTLQSFYQRLLPFAEPFMALFGRANLPHPATLSRFLAALDQAPVEALRTLFQEDLVARSAFASLFPELFCSVCLHSPQTALDLFFPRHFAVFSLHENVVVPLIVCLLSSRCVSRGTWQVIQDALNHWTIADLAELVHDTDEHGEDHTSTRQWVIWHLIEHDLHHGGELSFTLGMHGLTGITI